MAAGELQVAEASGLVQAFLGYGGSLTAETAGFAINAMAADRGIPVSTMWFELQNALAELLKGSATISLPPEGLVWLSSLSTLPFPGAGP